MEFQYKHMPSPMTDEFLYMFWIISDVSCDDVFDRSRAAVIEWCEERFGIGAVSTPPAEWFDLSPMGAAGVAASYAWIMTTGGDVAFQHVDHAFEFKFRWC